MQKMINGVDEVKEIKVAVKLKKNYYTKTELTFSNSTAQKFLKQNKRKKLGKNKYHKKIL